MKAPGSPRGRSRFDLGGRTWPAAAVWSVGATLYLSADKAGMIRTLTEADLARLCRLDERTVRAALVILRRLRVAKCSRPSRRRPVVWSMNLGGLDWPAVRNRAKLVRAEQVQVPLLDAASPGTMPDVPTDVPSAGRQPGLGGRSRRPRRDRTGGYAYNGSITGRCQCGAFLRAQGHGEVAACENPECPAVRQGTDPGTDTDRRLRTSSLAAACHLIWSADRT